MPLSKIPGLVLHLPMNEKNGVVANDNSRYGNDGALTGCKWVEHGLEFNGTSDYVGCGNDASLNCDDSMTVSIFTKFSPQSGDKMFLYKDGFATGWYLRTNVGGIIVPKIDDGANDCYANSPARYDDGIWHHICMVVEDRLLLILYIDGNKVSEGNASAVGSIINNTTLTIGKQTGAASRIAGSIDDIRIYNRALSAAEIQDLYNSMRHLYV